MRGLIGKKVGMTSVFDEIGRSIPVTVIEVPASVITQIKTVETDGYNAINSQILIEKTKMCLNLYVVTLQKLIRNRERR